MAKFRKFQKKKTNKEQDVASYLGYARIQSYTRSISFDEFCLLVFFVVSKRKMPVYIEMTKTF